MVSHRENSFDILRHVGALLVIYGHSFVLVNSTYIPAFFGMGVHTLGVKIFFVISGYLISQSWLRDTSLKRYFSRRFLRILPALVFCVVATAFVLGPIVSKMSSREYFGNLQTYRYLKNAAFHINYALPGVFEGNPHKAVNGSLWTLPVEMAAYIMCPLVLIFKNKFLLKITVILITIFSIIFDQITRGTPLNEHTIIYATSIIHANSLIVYFWIGCSISVLKLDRFFNSQIALILTFFMLCVPPYSPSYSFFLYFIIPYITLTFGTMKHAKIFSFFKRGDISYGLYLWAYPVQQVLISLNQSMNNPMVLFFASTIFTAFLALISWLVVEKPMLKFKPKTP